MHYRGIPGQVLQLGMRIYSAIGVRGALNAAVNQIGAVRNGNTARRQVCGRFTRSLLWI
jgi:hypothetical protein